MGKEPLFEIGKPVPSIWVHADFDFNDTLKYMNNTPIPDKEELDRLVNKYLNGVNE